MYIFFRGRVTFDMHEVLAVAHNTVQDWLAVGGFMGALLCTKIEEGKNIPDDITEDEHLIAHRGDIVHIIWNTAYERLTTADENGMIVVWKLHEGVWIQDMINQRERCKVAKMEWNSLGNRIAIGYEDGTVLVGSVEGEKVWSIDFNATITSLCWNPLGTYIMFGTKSGTVTIHESKGKYYRDMDTVKISEKYPPIVGLEWSDVIYEMEITDMVQPGLCIATEDGLIQFFRGIDDEQPVLVDSRLNILQMEWSTNQTLAVLGYKENEADSNKTRKEYEVQFYSAFGDHIRSLVVPGLMSVNSISWEGTESLSLAVGTQVMSIAVVPERPYAYAGETLAYTREEENVGSVVFWNTVTNEKHVKANDIVGVGAAGENFLCITALDGQESYNLEICDTIGVPIKKKAFVGQPISYATFKSYVAVASYDNVVVWNTGVGSEFLLAVSSSALSSETGNTLKFHLSDIPNSTALSEKDALISSISAMEDHFTATCINDKIAVVSRKSGLLCFISLHMGSINAIYECKCSPAKLFINYDGSGLAILDKESTLRLYSVSITADDEISCEQRQFERREVRDVIWSEDKPDLFAISENTGIYIYLGTNAEEPLQCTGHLCYFRDLVVKVADLDEIVKSGVNTKRDWIISNESRLIPDTRQLIRDVGLSHAYSFVEKNDHPRLWHIIAEEALEILNVNIAEKAFVKCADYRGIQFIKKLRVLDNADLQKAEVCIYFGRFDAAQTLYEGIGRIDLALEMREKVGDWFPVLRLAKEHHLGYEVLRKANRNIGLYYRSHNKYDMAALRFEESDSPKELLDCLLHLGDYEKIRELAERLPRKDQLLQRIGGIFGQLGIADWSAEAFLRYGDVETAIETCVQLCDWDRAVALANELDYEGIHKVLSKYAEHLISLGRIFDAIDLHRSARRYPDAARLISKMADEWRHKGFITRARKLYLAAALLLKRMEIESAGAAVAGAAVAGADLRRTWRCVEVCHIYSMALSTMWGRRFSEALLFSIRLLDYSDLFEAKLLYSCVSFIAFQNKKYRLCSHCFTRLETIEDIPATQKKIYRELALLVFRKYPLTEIRLDNNEMGICELCGVEKVAPSEILCATCKVHRFCIATGVTISADDVAENRTKKCKNCGNYVCEAKKDLRFCPLCHQPYPVSMLQRLTKK